MGWSSSEGVHPDQDTGFESHLGCGGFFLLLVVKRRDFMEFPCEFSIVIVLKLSYLFQSHQPI